MSFVSHLEIFSGKVLIFNFFSVQEIQQQCCFVFCRFFTLSLIFSEKCCNNLVGVARKDKDAKENGEDVCGSTGWKEWDVIDGFC